MSSKQSQLRQLMKLEREKKTVDPPPKAAVKSILKSKSSFLGSGNKDDDGSKTTFTEKTNEVKIEIVRKKRTKDKKKIKKEKVNNSQVDFEAIEKEVNEEELASNKSQKSKKDDGDDADQELEDFLNSVDDIEEEEKDEKESSQKHDVVLETKPDAKSTTNDEQNIDPDENAIDVGDEPQQLKQEMEMEQTAYEARLAKLMLLSRKRNSKEVSDTVIDFTPQLAFQDTSTTNDMSIDTLKGDSRMNKNDQRNDTEVQTQKSSNSMKELFRKKRSKKAKVSANYGDIEDDSFWS